MLGGGVVFLGKAGDGAGGCVVSGEDWTKSAGGAMEAQGKGLRSVFLGGLLVGLLLPADGAGRAAPCFDLQYSSRRGK